MHSFFGMSGSMSISADATCQGLQSPTVGVSTMKLEKGNTIIASHLFVISLYENEKRWQFYLSTDSHILFFKWIKGRVQNVQGLNYMSNTKL